MILDYLNTIIHLSLKLFIIVGILQVLKFEFLKFRILETLNFYPCTIDAMNCAVIKSISIKRVDCIFKLFHSISKVIVTIKHLSRLIVQYIGLVARKPDFVACKEERHRPACTSTQADQGLCYSLL